MSLLRTIRENRATVICGIIVALLVGGLLVARFATTRANGERLVALVHDSNGEVHTLPLDTDTTLVVTTDLGSNTIAVEDGHVRMLDSDCPQRTCVQVPALDAPGQQIICLPHQLWIEVVPEGSQGTSMDVSRAQDLDDNVDLMAR